MRALRSGTTVAMLAVGVLLASPLAPAAAVSSTAEQSTSARGVGAVRSARAAAPTPTPPAERPTPVRMVEVDAADFAAEAAALPAELSLALERDAGLTTAEWLAQAEASAVGVEVVDSLRDRIEVLDARLDGVELVVTVGSEADAAVVENVGARAEIGPAVERGDEPIEGLMPATDLRGGLPYYFSSNTYRCSIGFVGLDVVTDQIQMMTAGHCLGDGGPRNAASISRPTISGGFVGAPLQYLGNAGLHVTGAYPNPLYPTEPTYYDLGMTPVTGSGWTAKPEVVTWGGDSSSPPLSSVPLTIRDAGPALVGATVCKSGSTTGWTCGVITQVDTIEYVGTNNCETPGTGYCVASIVSNICVRAGDSGGAAVVGTRAVGITSASSQISGACSLDGLGVFTTLYSVNPAFEQAYKVYPDWEPLIGFSTPRLSTSAVNRFETSVGVSLPGGGIRHDVTLQLDQGGTLADEVNPSGAWSIDIGAVPGGTRNYTLTTTWGSGVQQSAPLSGRFLKATATRLWGEDRYSTSVQISQNGFPGTPLPSTPLTPGVPVVYLANGASFPDALSAGPAAALEGGPLLLTPSDRLPAGIAAELDRLNPDEIVIVGGAGVVSPAVMAAVAAYTTKPVVRLGGSDRYETSRLIAQRMLGHGLAAGQGLWVATGTNFPDALSAGAAAASQGTPILLVYGPAIGLDAATSSLINEALQSDRVYIAGGTGVVSEGVRTAITNLASTGTVTREGGVDRFETSLAINRAAYPSPASAPEVFLAYGYNFPDALSGSVVAGVRGGPLYITPTTCAPSGIVEHILDLSPTRVTVFSGVSIVSDAARDLTRC